VNELKVLLKGNELEIMGELTHETVMLALAQSIPLLTSNSHLKVNLQGISRCDSSSVAYLTALLRECKLKRTQLQLTHMPKQMRQISSVSGLDDILPIAES
jgi:anti-anti-sigma factor